MKEKHGNLFKNEIQPKVTGKNVDKAINNYFMNISYFHEYITLSTHEYFISPS